MKFNTLPPLKVLALTLLSIFQFSCSKDSDLLTDYVISDTSVSKGIANLVVDDTYQVSLSGSTVLDVLANDTFETGTAVVITETSAPINGTVAINNDETLTYTPNAEIIEQVSDTTSTSTVEVVDTFTYTAEVDNGEGSTTAEVASVVITAADNTARQNAVVNISPWDFCKDGNPIGGGVGYDAIVTSGDITITTSDTYSTFKTKVEAATSGQVVFINSNVSMDLTNLGGDAILVPGGVTIASDRGNGASNGALLYSNQVKYQGSGFERPVFVTAGTGVRFTGFNLRGPYGFSGTYSASDSELRLKYGISSNYSNTEVDNMHGYNWPSTFVVFSRYTSNSTFFGPLQESNNQRVHHNYIHNNLQNLRGYGVDSQNAYATVYANIFHSHRHDINTKGTSNSGYEAYCNTVISEFPANTGFTLNGAVGTKVYSITSDGSGNSISYNPKQSGNTHNNFENHAEYWCQDRYNYAECNPPTAASYIHHNDFQDDKVARHGQTSDAQNLSINGIPQNGNTRIEYNRTVRTGLIYPDAPDNDYFIRQLFVSSADQGLGLTLVGNVLDGATPPGQTGSIQN